MIFLALTYLALTTLSHPQQASAIDGATYIGCYTDMETRDLDGEMFQSSCLTPAMCLAFCQEQNATYFGLQGFRWCLCGDSYGKHGEATNCDQACTGDATEMCGGDWANSVYSIDNPAFVTYGSTYIGCYADEETRDLNGGLWTYDGMTRDLCRAYCQNKKANYFGLQAENNCLCGDSYGTYGETDICSLACMGDGNEICGNEWANSVYSIDYAANATGRAIYIGCYADEETRDLDGAMYTEDSMTVELCHAFCKAQNTAYFGVQAENNCLCGDSYGKYGETDICSLACMGDESEICGNEWANSIYAIKDTPASQAC